MCGTEISSLASNNLQYTYSFFCLTFLLSGEGGLCGGLRGGVGHTSSSSGGESCGVSGFAVEYKSNI